MTGSGHGRSGAQREIAAISARADAGSASLLAAELERALLRGEEPPGASLILEELRSDARDAGRKMPRARQSAAPVLRAARAVPGRRCADAQASRPHRARLPRSDLGMDQPRSDAAGGEDLCRSRSRCCSARTRRRAPSRSRARSRIWPSSACARRSLAHQERRQGARRSRGPDRHAERDRGCARDRRDPARARCACRDRLAPAAIDQQSCRRAARQRQDAARFADRAPPRRFSPRAAAGDEPAGSPWQLIRLAIEAAGSDAAARIAETPYAVAVEIVLDRHRAHDRELARQPQGRAQRRGRGAAEGHPRRRARLRTEIDLSGDSPWARQLAALRAEVSQAAAGRDRRPARPGAPRCCARGPPRRSRRMPTLDAGDVAEIEALLVLAAACRNYRQRARDQRSDAARPLRPAELFRHRHPGSDRPAAHRAAGRARVPPVAGRCRGAVLRQAVRRGLCQHCSPRPPMSPPRASRSSRRPRRFATPRR